MSNSGIGGSKMQFYNHSEVESEMFDDKISPEEEAFMRGYLEA